jgi:mycothiol synthase
MQLKDFQLKSFDAKTASDTMWQHIIDITETMYREKAPHDPLPPQDLLRQQLEHLAAHPQFDLEISLLYRSEKEDPIGLLMIGFAKSGSPDYDNQEHMVFNDIYVVEPQRRQGIGTMLLKHTVSLCQAKSIVLLQAMSETDTGNAFCDHYGFEVALRGRENRLMMDKVDWAMVEEWSQAGPKRAPGVEIITFEGLYEPDLEAYCKIYTETMNQQPLGELEGLESTYTPERMRDDHEKRTERGSQSITKITVEPDGTISGLTEIGHNPKTPHRVGQGLTGVQEAYRGRGLGKWLKAEMLLTIREHYPDIEFISTGNANTNAPMLSINDRLGFVLYKQSAAYKRAIVDLVERLGM